MRNPPGIRNKRLGDNMFGSEDYQKIARKTLPLDTGNLTDPNQHPAEKQVRSDMFAGAIGSYKNLGSH